MSATLHKLQKNLKNKCINIKQLILDMTIYKPSTKNLHMAANMLKKGNLVAFPTETVYGLGGDATSEDAILKIFKIKKRPKFNPLIIHCDTKAKAMKIGKFDKLSEKLINYLLVLITAVNLKKSRVYYQKGLKFILHHRLILGSQLKMVSHLKKTH